MSSNTACDALVTRTMPTALLTPLSLLDVLMGFQSAFLLAENLVFRARNF